MNTTRALLRSLLLLLGFAILSTGCQSLVYSPFVTPPSKPLQKDQGELTANANILPSVGGSIPGTYFSGSGDMLVRYAFSDRVTLQARTWATFGSLMNISVDGFSVEGIIMLNDSTSRFRFGLMPRAEVMVDGKEITGEAAFLSGIVWTPEVLSLRPYIGAGGGIGKTNLGVANGWGYAFLANFGASIDLLKDFSLNAELASVIQVNRYNNVVHGFTLPSAGLVWHF